MTDEDYSRFYREHHGAVRAYAARRVGGDGAAEVTAETFTVRAGGALRRSGLGPVRRLPRGFREGGTAPFYDSDARGDRSPDDVLGQYVRSQLAAEFVGRSRRAITAVATVQLRRGPGKVEATWFSPEGLPVAGVEVDRVGAGGTWLLGGSWACAVGPDPAADEPPVPSTGPGPFTP